jgi:nucleotide-binding universal stress UspA family protein
MYRRILLSYDGTAEGRGALREGARLAIAMRSEVYLLAICRSMMSSAVPEGHTPELVACEEDTARELLEDGVRRLKARGLNAKGELAIGDALRLIPEVAARIGADLIVVGYRPRGRLARWWSDSPQQSLLDFVPCSLLVAMNAEPDE